LAWLKKKPTKDNKAEDVLQDVKIFRRSMENDIEIFIDHMEEVNNLEEDASQMVGAAKCLKRTAKKQKMKMWWREKTMQIGLACLVGGTIIATALYFGIRFGSEQ
jgi:hypothetical protein